MNAVRTKDKRKVSDVLDVILFLAQFLNNHTQSKKQINDILSGDHGLLVNGQDIFKDKFAYIKSLSQESKKMLFDDIKKRLFNGESAGKLHLQHLSGSGELILRIGENQPFGLINVGDASDLRKLCSDSADGNFLVSPDSHFSQSYFGAINKPDSTINILIGAKKFTEGWNSWRVSTMGLMNVGKTEGAQIIQLFGRGVRLKGKGFSLKRSNDEEVKGLELLNVFGLESKYMEQFNKFLLEEGVQPTIEIPLPVVLNPEELNFEKETKLKIVQLKKGRSYKKDCSKKPEISYAENIKITLDLYSKIQAASSTEASIDGHDRDKESISLPKEYMDFINLDKVYLELEQLKQERNWYNLIISIDSIRTLLKEEGWYTLYIPESKQRLQNFGQALSFWEETAFSLLRKYTERLYKVEQAQWEQKHLEYQDIQKEESNLLWVNENAQYQYTVEVDASKQDLIREIKIIGDKIKKKKRIDCESLLFFKHHLYEPLIVDGEKLKDVKVTPVPLKGSEKSFIDDLSKYISNNKDFFKEKKLYLLRNQSRRGVKFFNTLDGYNFYPDFIVWILYEGKQYINLIEPHGIGRMGGINDDKINLSHAIKDIEAQLAVSDIVLNSFILSTTSYGDKGWWNSHKQKSLEEKNLFFMDKPSYIKNMMKKVLEKT